jgi:protein SCO1
MTASAQTRDDAGAPRGPLFSSERRRDWLTACAGGLVAAAGAGAAYLPWISPRIHAQRRAQPARRTGSRLPDVPLITHDGRQVRFYSDLVRGRLVFISMMYTQCSERCPPMTQALRGVQEALGDRVGRDVFMYSISLLPEYDRPADLQAYRELHRVGPGWTFLTGAKKDVEQVRYALGFYDADPEIDADLGQHTGMVRIGNDALDRWCMTFILSEPHLILEAFMGVDPVSRAAGASWARPMQS